MRPVLTDANNGRVKGMTDSGNDFYDESLFSRMLSFERRRTRRSGKPFILILLDVTGLMKPFPLAALDRVQRALASKFRETDFRGWYMRDSVIGIVLTELDSVGPATRAVLFGKMQAALVSHLGPGEMKKIYVTFHTFPSVSADAVPCGRFDLVRRWGEFRPLKSP